MGLGTVLTHHEEDLSGALACFKKELQIDQERRRRRSTDTRYSRGVAMGYSHVGQAYDRLGDTERSAENFPQGLQVSKELVLADPKNTHFQQGLAIAYANTANELSKMARCQQRLGYIEKGDEIMGTVSLAPENKQQRGPLTSMRGNSNPQPPHCEHGPQNWIERSRHNVGLCSGTKQHEATFLENHLHLLESACVQRKFVFLGGHKECSIAHSPLADEVIAHQENAPAS